MTGGLLGSSRNKVGSVVTYRSKGQDIARSLAANISNPRTTSQMEQRVRLANIVNTYKANAAWMSRYAFARRPTKWSVYNAFTSANIGSETPYLSKSEAAAGCAIVSPYKFTDGTIPSIVHYPFTGGNGRTDLYLGQGFEITEATTVGQFSEALLTYNNGLQAGWQLSLIINYQQSNGNTYYILPRYYEVTLAVGDTTPLSDRMPLDHISAVPTTAQTNTQLTYVAGAGDPETGYMFCLSKKVGGVVDVSSQYMTLTDTGLYNSFTEGSKLASAAASYGSSDTAFLEPGYQGQQGSDQTIELPQSILRVALNGNYANVGDYLGTWGGEQPGTISVLFNRDVQADTVQQVSISWPTSGGGTISYTTGFTYDGATLTVAVPEGDTPLPNGAITSVVVTFTTATALRATFKASDEVEE